MHNFNPVLSTGRNKGIGDTSGYLVIRDAKEYVSVLFCLKHIFNSIINKILCFLHFALVKCTIAVMLVKS